LNWIEGWKIENEERNKGRVKAKVFRLRKENENK